MKKTLLLALMLFSGTTLFAQKAKHSFKIENGDFIYDGKPIQLHSGELHFARVPKEYWRHRLKMVKAMGLNAVATYIFWNYHEVAPGVWDFKTDNRNISEFVKIAGEEGLMVILRPGPYACAEWEYGGYPWFLQNVEGLEVRRNNPKFLEACKVYINKLAAEVKNLQITKGGPIIMVQAENEFGSYVAQRKDIPLAEHKQYSAAIKQQLLDAGFDVPLFTSDGSWLFEGGSIDGALPTANGEDNIENLKKVVNQYNGNKGPYMVAEFYPGWLDHWAEPFPKVPTEDVVKQTEKYLKNNVSFNYYMVHGGTNFGYTTGANYDKNHDIQPDMTSYDYDAPISEAGWATPKYQAIRELLKKHVSYKIPEVPVANNVIEIPEIKLTKSTALFGLKSSIKPIADDKPLTFEQLNQGHGFVLYSRKFNQPISGKLELNGLRDYALIYVNGEKVAELNRYYKNYTCEIDIPFNATVDILVENMGRINYGAKITENNKGIISPVIINGNQITGNWQMYKMPLEEQSELSKLTTKAEEGQPTVLSGSFNLTELGDTFLDMEQWGKGIVFVNGHHLGRYWSVGPQQTLYVPGCWLKKGQNDIVVVELKHIPGTTLKGVKTPVLDKLNTDVKP
ncbi:glycoside hydrolase family 35 protein [Solitalea lacus]|uniref:glycoside hydrolase family 35 protein n=1 Tax=Solitalea lacus TaxID=2911172 RepID=UPI001EDB4762|nr:beta-galactosidase family protein [Solitalea lacus]UKJ06493.1 beta-galactosidase [Solitalea lacus]